MKTFNIYKHPTQGYEAVKVGFSWPAFFFGGLWMLAKKLWGIAGLWLAAYIVCSLIDTVIGKSQEGGSQAFVYLALAATYFSLWLIPPFRGNKWREENLSKRGYYLLNTVQTKTPDAAVAQVPSFVANNTDFPNSANTERFVVVQQGTVEGVPAPSRDANIASLADHLEPTVNEDSIYATIARELETSTTDQGLWTRLFAECDGDEGQTKVLYIKQRADRLISAERLRLEKAAKEYAAEAARLESVRQKKELSVKIQALSTTNAAAMMLKNVAQNNLQEVNGLLSEEPLFIAVTSRDGDTPLHIAVREKSEAMTRFLLERGAIVEAKNNYGVTPLEYAKNSRQSKMVELLSG